MRGQYLLDAVRFVLGLSERQELIQAVISVKGDGASQQLPFRRRVIIERPAHGRSSCGVGASRNWSRRWAEEGCGWNVVRALLRLIQVVELKEEPGLDVVDGSRVTEAQKNIDVIKSGQTMKRKGLKVPLVGIATGLLGLT